MKTLKIDIVSDVVCPWCAVGYANLSSALNTLSQKIDANIQWHPFQLNPYMPKQGQAIDEHLSEKYGLDAIQLKQNQQHLVEVGEKAGIEFNFNQRSRIFNTLDCHVLLDFAQNQNKQTQLKLALFKAYFGEGLNVSDQTVLIKAAVSVGLEQQEVENALADETLREKVKAEEEKYKSLGINSVPAFIVNDQYLISGGQPVESFVQALTEISEKDA
ncbi:DsbA family oxidoreductase [Bermanella sp. WJH001]|uniref:DsbA family oxidoreductase n=1 Tax=Bermanella sp. WJH001 TaxID=3048005 RepID=UPI0024BD61FB|nr:DsbA family oxidoreductase [Bermanella sp. WJH001]MDJ1539367.1 DsbA family oxidoreductase [Bermanella sp. WJH001]